MMALGGDPTKKQRTWTGRVVAALAVVALVVVVVVMAGNASEPQLGMSDAVASPMEALESTSSYPEFVISVNEDDMEAPEASEEGELVVFEEEDMGDADEEEAKLKEWNEEEADADDDRLMVVPEKKAPRAKVIAHRLQCHRSYIGCVKKCPLSCRYSYVKKCGVYGRRCRRVRKKFCRRNVKCRLGCGSKHRGCGRVVGRHVFASMATGKVMDVWGNSKGRGAKIIQWAVHCGGNQRFNVITSPVRGQYYVQSVSSKLYLDIAAHSGNNGARLIQWTLHGGGNQRFQFLRNGKGSVWIVAVHSGKALDVPGARNTNGLQIIQWQKHGGANQQWLLVN